MTTPASDAANDLLAYVVAHLVDPPTRRIVTPGRLPPVACELVAVSWEALDSSDRFPTPNPATRQPLCATIPILRLCVEIHRCVAVIDEEGRQPSMADATADGQRSLDDGWRLWTILADGKDGGGMFSPAGCRQVSWPSVTPIGPSGGFGGVRACLVVQVSAIPGGYGS